MITDKVDRLAPGLSQVAFRPRAVRTDPAPAGTIKRCAFAAGAGAFVRTCVHQFLILKNM